MNMNREKIELLLAKYNGGSATDDDLQLIENLIDKGLISLHDLNDVDEFDRKIEMMQGLTPSVALDDRFYEMLAREKKQSRKFDFGTLFSFDSLFSRMAFAALTFLLGLGVGYAVFTTNVDQATDVKALSLEVKNLREMMMLSLLEKESATERLKAVSMSHDLDDASVAVTKALLKTLNNDENANVRLAALEALQPYGNDSEVRKELIRSISRQNSPLVQIALAELMASWQEKSSVKEFDKLLNDEATPGDVKKRIRKSIEILI